MYTFFLEHPIYFSATYFFHLMIFKAEFSVRCTLAKRQSKVFYPSKPHKYNYFFNWYYDYRGKKGWEVWSNGNISKSTIINQIHSF